MGIRHLPVVAMALIGASAAGAEVQQPQMGPQSDQARIVEINRALMAAVKANDPVKFDSLTLDQLRVLAPGGRLEDKAMVLKGLGTVVGDLALSQEDVTIVGDTAILTGKMQGDAVMEPFGKLPPMKFIATFVRTEGGWKMLSRAITPCAPVAIERGVC